MENQVIDNPWTREDNLKIKQFILYDAMEDGAHEDELKILSEELDKLMETEEKRLLLIEEENRKINENLIP